MATSHSKLTLSDDEWRQRLTPEEFDVLRRGATEEPYTGEYTDTTIPGAYHCRACHAEVFCSTAKFDPDTGFPSFFDAARTDAVILRPDNTEDKVRSEVLCAVCDSHLGHFFSGEGYPTPVDQRYCIDSIALKLVPTVG
jgi:peptide-methionine (R)-S-oxide reductase